MTDWGRFPDTVLHFRIEQLRTEPLVVDLREPVSPRVISSLRAFGFERLFGIITAENPMGELLPPEVNLARATELLAEVAELQVPQLRLDACSPDRSHCEESIAVAIGLERLIAIANRYDQLAVFWFDGDVFWIEPARSSKPRLRLPVLI